MPRQCHLKQGCSTKETFSISNHFPQSVQATHAEKVFFMPQTVQISPAKWERPKVFRDTVQERPG